MVHACSNTRFEWHKVVNYLANLPTTYIVLTKGALDNLRHVQRNKHGTLSCKNVLSLHKRHWSSCNRGLVASQQVTRMFSSKNPDNHLKGHVCSPYIPPTLCISITFMTSLNDITIICFPLPVGKTLCMCRRAMPAYLHTHWHPCQLFFYSYAWTISLILYPKFQACDIYILEIKLIVCSEQLKLELLLRFIIMFVDSFCVKSSIQNEFKQSFVL